jgi:protein-tyrosine phosphatase
VWQPNHPILNQISRLTSGPLISSLAVAKQGPIADQVSNLGLAPFVLAVDDGEVHHPGEPTIVSMDGNQGRIVHHGVVSEQELKFISKWTVLFVCTGNTCRSPMAQALMQRKIAERYPGTATSDDISIVALSAGVSAFGGDPASHGAATAIRNFGTTLDQHQSTQLNSDLVEQADVILAMGNRHRQVIVSQWPNVAHKVHLISPDGGEISDPFGGPLDVYLKCAQQLDDYTTYWMDRLDVESLIQWKPAS